MKNTQGGFIVPLLITIIALLVVGGGAYIYLNQQPKTLNVNQVENIVATTSDSSINTQVTSPTQNKKSDVAIASIVFPSSQWTSEVRIIAGNPNATVYVTKGQKSNLPIEVINSIKRSKDGNDAIVSTQFIGADSATGVNFVHNLLSQPILLNFPNGKFGLPSDSDLQVGKTNITSPGFNSDGTFSLVYTVFGDSQQFNYAIVNDQIIETGKLPLVQPTDRG